VVAGVAAAADLVIVSPPALRDSWEYYAASRRSAVGQQVQVVGTDWIYARHPFGSDGACSNAAESVRAFMREAHAGGTTNFLLGGAWIEADKLEAPIWLLTGERLSLSNAVPGRCVRPHGERGLEATPTDWVDDGLEMVVGRFPALPFAYGEGPVLSAAQLITNYAAKVARGESADFAGTRRLGMVGATQWDQAPSGSSSLAFRAEMRLFDGVPNLWSPAHVAQVSDGESVLRQTLHELVLPNWPVAEVVSLYYADGPTIAAGYGDFAATRDALLSQDLLYLSCRTHGHVQIAMNAGGNSWLTRSLYAKATGLARFADFGVPCRCGMVDYTTVSNGMVYAVPSLGAAMVASPLGGCLAGVFNSRDGIGTFTATYLLEDGLSTSLATQFTRYLFEVEGISIGEALRRARRQFCSCGTMSADRQYALKEQFLLGDPTLRMPVETKCRVESAAIVRLDDEEVQVSMELHAAQCVIEGNGELRVMECVAHSGTNLVIGVGGGIGRGVVFESARPGRLELNGEGNFLLGGVSNCEQVVVSGGRKTVRCVERDRQFAGTFSVNGGTLVVESAETLGNGDASLAVVTNGTLEWAVSPKVGWPDGGEHLVRTMQLVEGELSVQTGSGLSWGRAGQPFRLEVEGECSVRPATTNAIAAVGLSGMTAIDLAANSELTMAVELTDEGSGRLVLSGAGTMRCASEQSLAGSVDVNAGTTLVLAKLPLPAVTDLVVRAGAVLVVPSSPSGRHQVVPTGASLVVENGARVIDGSGMELVGKVANGTFFEASTALRWKGGDGVWSDGEGWFDYVTGAFGPWRNGRVAVFDASEGSQVTNDVDEVEVAGLVFDASAEFWGAGVHCASGDLLVPTGVAVEFHSQLAVTNDVVKRGGGCLAFAGVQSGLGSVALRTLEGVLALSDVDAPSVTNLVVSNGARLELDGTNVLCAASSRAAVATNALVCAGSASTVLALREFTPSKSLRVPAGITIEVWGPIADDGGRTWTAQVEGMIDYHGILSGVYGWLEGAGTVRVAGIRSRSSSGVGFGACRLEWQGDENGVFPLLGFMGRNPAFIVLDGTTVVPQNDVVIAGAAGTPNSCAALYVDEQGATFEVDEGRLLVLGDDADSLLFGGPGAVVKTGTGELWLPIDDQHTGLTRVREGRYWVGGKILSQAFELGVAAVLNLTGGTATTLRSTNFVWRAGASVCLGVEAYGNDMLDWRGCEFGEEETPLKIVVVVTPEAPAGFYQLLQWNPEDAAIANRLQFEVGGTRGRRATLEHSPDGVCLRLGPYGTTLLLR